MWNGGTLTFDFYLSLQAEADTLRQQTGLDLIFASSDGSGASVSVRHSFPAWWDPQTQPERLAWFGRVANVLIRETRLRLRAFNREQRR